MNTEKIIQRFWSKVAKSDRCWQWTGARMTKGYGIFVPVYSGKSGRAVGAHRYSWSVHFGAIPGGMFVCHHCDNPGCVRPDHLFLGTPSANINDMTQKGRHHNQRKTHCPQGHAYDETNTARQKSGGRCCRACDRQRARRRYAEKTSPNHGEF